MASIKKIVLRDLKQNEDQDSSTSVRLSNFRMLQIFLFCIMLIPQSHIKIQSQVRCIDFCIITCKLMF